MATAIGVGGVRLHCHEVGDGDETLVFSHGYLMNHRMFAAQVARLRDRYRIVAYDHRGHGGSERWREPYDIYTLVEDGARVIEQRAGGGPVHWVGMSTGGYVGMRLMVRRPELLRSVTLIDTAAGSEPAESLRQYELLLTVVRWLGVRPVLSRALSLLMGEPFRTDPDRRTEYVDWVRQIRGLDARSLVAFGKAIFHRDDVLEALRATTIPASVLVGELDQPTPPSRARLMAEALRTEPVLIHGAGHTSPIERPDAVSDAVESFLASLPR